MSEEEIEIRPASADDIPAIQLLIAPYVQQRKLLPRSDEDLHRLILHGFTAVHQQQVVGFSAVEVYSLKMAELQCLAVAREVQGRGLGKRLIEKCIDRARELNIIELMAITASEELFTACGFHYSLPDQKKALFIQTRDPH